MKNSYVITGQGLCFSNIQEMPSLSGEVLTIVIYNHSRIITTHLLNTLDKSLPCRSFPSEIGQYYVFIKEYHSRMGF